MLIYLYHLYYHYYHYYCIIVVNYYHHPYNQYLLFICHQPPTSITTHYQPKYVHHHPSTTHHQPKYIHHHPPSPKQWTTTQQKPKYIQILLLLTVSFSSKCNISVMEILCDKVSISSFFKFKISTTFYVI